MKHVAPEAAASRPVSGRVWYDAAMGPGPHQRRCRRTLIRGSGRATTAELLAGCYPQGPKNGHRFDLQERWSMQRAARRWARSVAYGQWEAKRELMRLITGK
jgi:hypothetical protein